MLKKCVLAKVSIGLTLFMAFALTALAQSTTPKAEVFGGYAYTNLDGPEDTHGFGLNIAANFNRHFGLAADLSFGWGEVDVPAVGKKDFDTQTYLFGPRLYARGEKVTGFGHVLFGAHRTNFDYVRRDATKFAMGLGGGLDLNLSDKFAIRAAQLDWLPVNDRNLGGFDGWSHNFRVQTGIVFRFGSH